MSEKPEWFQITEGDEKPEIKKSKKGYLKIAAVALPLVVVGAFAVGANGEEEDDAPKFSTSITSNVSTSKATAKSSATTISEVPVISPKVAEISNSTIGVQPPKGEEDDDHEGFEGGDRSRFDDDDHEGREHHREGRFSKRN